MRIFFIIFVGRKAMEIFMKKNIVLLFALAALLVLSACGSSADEISVNVKISSDYTITDSSITLKKASPVAADAIIEACKAGNISYKYQNGMFDSFSGIESTKEDGWLLYINGNLAQTGAGTASISDGDRVEFSYVNYDRAFNSASADYIGKWKSGIASDGSYAFLNIDDSEASFTYGDAQNNLTSYAGTYLMTNNTLTINDAASNSPVTIPFKMDSGKLIIEYGTKSIELLK